MQSVIAIPVYSLNDNSTITGVWAGGIDFSSLNKELQSLNITSLSNSNNTRVVYIGHNGQKVADSNTNTSKIQESFATLNSFKDAISGKSGSIIDTVTSHLLNDMKTARIKHYNNHINYTYEQDSLKLYVYLFLGWVFSWINYISYEINYCLG